MHPDNVADGEQSTVWDGSHRTMIRGLERSYRTLKPIELYTQG